MRKIAHATNETTVASMAEQEEPLEAIRPPDGDEKGVRSELIALSS